MASRKSWKLGSSKNKTKKNKKKNKKKVKDRTFLDLPFDLLHRVISNLPLKDNIRASTVCRTWHEACVSIRVKDKSPWLIYFSNSEGSYELYDPSKNKTYNLEFPELSGFRVCYSKDGWLLMYNPNTIELFLFNPFTRNRISVPSNWMAYDQRMAFSCAPTSSNCVLFTITHVTSKNITIETCCPNAFEWNTFVFKNRLSRNYNNFEQIVFSNGVFYCLTNTGCLSFFDPSLITWNVLPGRPPKRPGRKWMFHDRTSRRDLSYLYVHSHESNSA